MHLMLVNDDGIHAPGIQALCSAALAAGHKVSICAPDQERSAASHSITLRRALRAAPVSLPGVHTAYAVDGTPADSARLGLYLIPDVDAVLSGINNGPNLGGACIYSGTVAAATEASMTGVPALAVSQCSFENEDYTASAQIALRVLEWMAKHPLPRGEIYNLNVPNLPLSEIKGVRAASMSPIYLDSAAYNVEETPDGPLYRYTAGENVPITDPDGDVLLSDAGYATLTRLTWNLRAEGPDPDLSDLQL